MAHEVEKEEEEHHLLGKACEEVSSPQEVQDQVELPLRLESCGIERVGLRAERAVIGQSGRVLFSP